jgi:hypothetical protein
MTSLTSTLRQLCCRLKAAALPPHSKIDARPVSPVSVDVPRLRFLPLLVLLLACDQPLPTEPEPAVAPLTHNDPRPFRMDPWVVTVEPGQTGQAVIRLPWTLPLGVEFRSTKPAVAAITGKIAPGGSEGVVHVTGVAPGQAQVLVVIWEFGRGPAFRQVGTIIVPPLEPTRRRSIRH